MFEQVLFSSARRRSAQAALPSAITSSNGSAVEVTNATGLDTVLTALGVTPSGTGTWAISGWDGVKLVGQTATTAQVATARAFTDADTGVKSATITFTAPGVNLSYDLQITANAGAITVFLPFGGKWFGTGPATVNPYNYPFKSNRVTYSMKAPFTGLITSIYCQIASNKSSGESKSGGIGIFDFSVELRGHRAGSATGTIPSLPGAAISRQIARTHNRGTTVGGAGGDQRRQHHIDLFQQPRGVASAANATKATLQAAGSVAFPGPGSSTSPGYYSQVTSYIIWTTGAAAGKMSLITAYSGGTRELTYNSISPAPSAGDAYAIGVLITKDAYYHAVFKNEMSNPSVDFCSINAGSQFTNGTDPDKQTARNFTPFGLTPPRRSGVGWGDDTMYCLTSTGGTYPNETYSRREGMCGWFGFDYEVPNLGRVLYSPEVFDTGGDTSIWKVGTIGAGHRLRQRWKQPYDFTARKLWIPLYYQEGARPNANLTVELIKETGTGAGVAKSWSVAAATAGVTPPNTDTTKVKEWLWANKVNARVVDHVALDIGADYDFEEGETYRVELSSSTTTNRYYAWLGKHVNAGMTVYDNDLGASNYTRNNRCGNFCAFRDDPATPGKPAKAEHKAGDAASWKNINMYGTSGDPMVQLQMGFTPT